MAQCVNIVYSINSNPIQILNPSIIIDINDWNQWWSDNPDIQTNQYWYWLTMILTIMTDVSEADDIDDW